MTNNTVHYLHPEEYSKYVKDGLTQYYKQNKNKLMKLGEEGSSSSMSTIW